MKTATLTNSFHRTSIRVRIPYDTTAGDYFKAREEQAFVHRTPADVAWVRRIENALCGIKGCACGIIRD